MDLLTFIASLVEALIWPLTAFAILWLLRKQITEIIGLLRRVKLGDIELELGRELSEIKREVKIPRTDSKKPALPQTIPLPDRITQIAATAPRAAVREAWKELETEIYSAASRYQLDDPTAWTAKAVVRDLETKGKLPERTAEAFFRVEILKTKFVDLQSPPLGDADVALELADIILEMAFVFKEV